MDELHNDLSSGGSPAKAGGGTEAANGTVTADAIMLDGKVISSSDVLEMKKNIDDLELVNKSREKRINEVCHINPIMCKLCCYKHLIDRLINARLVSILN